MPYIFVRGTLNSTGLFSNETFIDFQNVEDGNGEFVGAILSRQFGGAYSVTENKNGYPQKGQQMQWLQFHPLPDTFFTIGVDMQPTVVLNRLEIHAGYKVVAANQQRPLPIHRSLIHGHQGLLPSCPVSYTLWTLHKPLPWNITANALKFNSYQLFFYYRFDFCSFTSFTSGTVMLKGRGCLNQQIGFKAKARPVRGCISQAFCPLKTPKTDIQDKS